MVDPSGPGRELERVPVAHCPPGRARPRGGGSARGTPGERARTAHSALGVARSAWCVRRGACGRRLRPGRRLLVVGGVLLLLLLLARPLAAASVAASALKDPHPSGR
ncbi:hypothetical protein [Kitasatospora sp. NPDC089509]|uniref:hypothetical protein n=1 Tax=Kitasatospora sp. NPDC089509 TaxID=3364079 RepID=UPI003811E90D